MRFRKYLTHALPGMLSAIITFLVYIPSLANGFVNIDDWLFYENPHIVSFDLKSAFTEVVASNWHPLTVISVAIDYKFWGLNPFGYHLGNIILHSLNTFLVFILALRLAGLGRGLRYRVTASAVAALLFGLHPIHVESVSWIAERKDVLCAFFFISSLIAYTYFAAGGPRLRALKYLAALVLFVLALMSKPMAVSLPLVLIIIDFYPLDRLKSPGDIKRLLAEKIPFFLFSSLSALLTLWAQQASGAIVSTGTYPLAWRLRFSARALIFYLDKTLLPVGLSPVYPIDAGSVYFSLVAILSAAIILTITLFTALLAKKYRIFLAAWVYYIITLIPVSGIIQVGAQSAADRYMYLPSLSLLLLAGAGIGALFEKGRKFIIPASACLIIILLALSAMTIKQQAIWKNSIALWTHEIENFPFFPRAHNDRGSAYDDAGRYEEALRDYNTAIRLEPYYPEAYVNRGITYRKMKNYDQSVNNLLTAIRINPRLGVAYHHLALTLLEMGETKAAAEAESKASELGYK